MQKKLCAECSELIKGRADKKFCSDACRNSYNNKLNSYNTSLIRNTNNALRKNRRILESLWQADKEFTVVKLSQLSSQGFDFDLITQYYTAKNGNTYSYIYDFGYRKLEDEKILIVKKQAN